MQAIDSTIDSTTVPVREVVPAAVPADVPVERSVVGETVRRAAADAVARERAEHPEEMRGVRPADAGSTSAAYEAASPERTGLLAHLRSTVVGYVAERCAAGAPVERVLPEVKDLVREAASHERSVDRGGTLTAQVVRWTIEAYYDQPGVAHVPHVD